MLPRKYAVDSEWYVGWPRIDGLTFSIQLSEGYGRLLLCLVLIPCTTSPHYYMARAATRTFHFSFPSTYALRSFRGGCRSLLHQPPPSFQPRLPLCTLSNASFAQDTCFNFAHFPFFGYPFECSFTQVWISSSIRNFILGALPTCCSLHKWYWRQDVLIYDCFGRAAIQPISISSQLPFSWTALNLSRKQVIIMSSPLYPYS